MKPWIPRQGSEAWTVLLSYAGCGALRMPGEHSRPGKQQPQPELFNLFHFHAFVHCNDKPHTACNLQPHV